MVGVVAQHGPKVGHHVGRKGVLVRRNAHGFKIIGILKLRFRRLIGVKGIGMRTLLNLFVGKFVSRKLLPQNNVQPVPGSQVALVMGGEISDSAGVRVVLRNHGIQIVAGHIAAGAHAEGILSPDVLPLRKRPRRVETASGKHRLPVEAGLRVLQGVDLDDSPHFSTVLSRNARSINAHRLHIVGFDLRPEAGGTVVRKGNTVHDELCLVFGAAGMQDGVAFVQPAGLRVHQVLE